MSSEKKVWQKPAVSKIESVRDISHEPIKFAQVTHENQGHIVGELIDIRQQLLLISHFSTFKGQEASDRVLMKLNQTLDRINGITRALRLAAD